MDLKSYEVEEQFFLNPASFFKDIQDKYGRYIKRKTEINIFFKKIVLFMK